MNNLHIPEALSRHSWWYRRDFELPRGLRTGAGRRIWLEFDGVNHQADIWLNGEQVGGVTYPFARSAHDVTAAAGAGGEQRARGEDHADAASPAAPATRAPPARPSWTPAPTR